MTKYAVATGTWDASNTSIWADSDGGAPGATAPTAGDDVRMSALSGNITITVAAGWVCRSMDRNGFTGTFAGSAAASIGDATAGAGNIALRLGAAENNTNTSAITLISTSATQQAVHTNGNSWKGSITVNANSGGNFVLGDAFTSTSFFTVLKGTFNTGNFNLEGSAFTSTGTSTRVVTLGTSTLRLRNAFSLTGSGLTFSGASSTIIIDNKTNATTITFNGLGQTFGAVCFHSVTNPTATIVGSNSYASWSVYCGVVVAITSGTTQTITGGARAIVRIGRSIATIRAVTAGSAATLANAVAMVLSGFSIKDITGSGGSHLAQNCVSVSGNSGITFSRVRDRSRIVQSRNPTIEQFSARKIG